MPVLFLLYAYRSLLARFRTNVVTMLSIALFITGAGLGLSFYLSLKRMLVDSAPPENIIVVAEGAVSEGGSRLDLDTVRRIAVRDEIKKTGDQPLLARELVSLTFLETPSVDEYKDPVTVRGIDERSLDVHRIKIISGAAPAPKTLEVMLGKRVAQRFPSLTLGTDIALPGGAAKVAGIFSENGGSFEDEIWMQRSALELHLKATYVTSTTLVAASLSDVPKIIDAINNNKDIKAQAQTLASFREKGASLGTIALVILVLLVLLSVIATIAIATTMSASVLARIPELAALAAIGVPRSVLARVVLVESTLLATIAVVIGVGLSTFIGDRLGEISIGATATTISPSGTVVGVVLALGVCVGILGGLVPAIRVLRLEILQALR